MTILYEEVKRIPFCPQKSKQYKVEIDGDDIVIFRGTDWCDITDDCCLEYKKSTHNSGRYMAIKYGSDTVAVIGIDGIQEQHGFKVIGAPGAKISFQVYKKRSH